MTILLDRQIDRTLDALVERFANEAHRGARLEAWVFEDLAARNAAELRLAGAGIRARLRSAYKPLVHFFLEEGTATPSAVTVQLPSHKMAPEQRFRLEAFPLAGLLGAATLRFEQGPSELDHHVLLEQDGRVTEHRVFAPNRAGKDHLGQAVLTPTGWLRVWRDGGSGEPDEDGPLPTEYEQAFAAIMAAIADHPWPGAGPYFDVLAIDVELPGIKRRLTWHDECLSTSEAMHEDLYFSALEIFQRHAGLKLGDRTLQPGQIVPDIRTVSGPARVRVEIKACTKEAEPAAAPVLLDSVAAPLQPSEIRAALDELGGTRIEAVSRQGRAVEGVLVNGSGPGLVISGGQHANETTGVVGALRAAALLRRQGALFAVIPQENPDGYALHRQLRRNNPRHMHHAARYTALGDDLQYRTRPPLYEKAARLEAFRLTGAGLHINLHGYPAHEWNRPLTGYLTRGFEPWSIPQGFYLILRHPPGTREAVVEFLQELTARVSRVPGLRALNDSQVAAWAGHTGHRPEPIYNGIPCRIVESTDLAVPFTLITEFPDETIYDDAFRLGHTTQMTAAFEGAMLYRGGMLRVAA